MAKKITLAIVIFVLLIFSGILITPRKKIVKFFSVNNSIQGEKIDIYFVFSGGFVKKHMGKSTKERVEFLKKLLDKNPETPFVFLDYKGGKQIVSNLLGKRKNNQSLNSNYRYNEHLGGTENNVLELISILKTHPEFKKIGIVTSIYHEKRIKLILDYHIKQENLTDVKVYFLHDSTHQEIYTCSFFRYLKLIMHELGGILYFKLRTIFN